jgi:ADP-ribose pyrophosphatase YjhB (NUDIX family)
MDKEFNKSGLTQDEFLRQYDASEFERPSVAVDIVLFTITEREEENYRKLPLKELKVLLVKRNAHPFQGMWALPGGFIGIDESIEGSARRKLKAKTNIENIYIEQLYTWGDVLRDPRTRVLSCSYMSLIDSSQLAIKPGKSEDDARWFGVKFRESRRQRINTENGYTYERDVEIALENGDDRLNAVIRITYTFEEGTKDIKREIMSSQGIAFDHGKIIEYGIERLRNKIEYTDIAFNLMPKHFTLTELQKVYEIIQGKELLAAAFRRKIADMVIETNEYTKDAGHRPSKLYKFNAEWENNL